MSYIARDFNDILTELVRIINALDITPDIFRDFARCHTNMMFCLDYQCSRIQDGGATANVRDRVDAHVSAASRSLLQSFDSGHSCCILFIRKELHRAVEVLMNAAIQA
jgi:hypothetical protein